MPSLDEVPRALWDCGRHVPTRPRAREALLAALDEGWADPTRLHREGRAARALLDGARQALAARLGVRTEEIWLVSSFGRAVQTAMLGTLRGRTRVGDRLVHTAIDHSAVLGCARWHRDERGGAVSELSVDGDGRVEETAFAAAVGQPGVALAVRQFGNGEVGTLQQLDEAAEASRAAAVPLLVDAGAAAGHVALPRADLLVVDPGSWGAPPGGGVLAIRAGIRWRQPWPDDGQGPAHTPSADQVSVPQALAMAVAAEEAAHWQAAADGRRRRAVDRLRARLPDLVPDLQVVGDPVGRLPHIVTFSVLFADGQTLVEQLDRAGFAVGSGSACAAGALHPSHVLAAMGALTHGNVRIALPAHVDETTLQRQVAAFERVLPGIVTEVRERVGGAGL